MFQAVSNSKVCKGLFMRSLYILVAGILIGLTVQLSVAGNQNRGVVSLNHVGVSVPDLDEAVTFYTKTMGFPEAFRVVDETGQPALVYVQVSQNTFVELQPANAERPPGISHFGVQVEDMDAATTTFRKQGANVSDIRVGSTKVILSNISDLNGIRIELLEVPPDSLTWKAMERWQ
jgi:catechol 2,3-dioxygenase-like lactoylglutathione lyase family enzyme